MSGSTIIVVILLLLGALPTWPYSTGWGYYPSGCDYGQLWLLLRDPDMSMTSFPIDLSKLEPLKLDPAVSVLTTAQKLRRWP